jgi:hypothetical protein
MSSGAPNFPRSPGQHSWRKTGITLYVVYCHPRDYPEEFVVRRWTLDQPERGDPFLRGASLDDVRALLPPGLYNLGRHEDDDPVIVEVWV